MDSLQLLHVFQDDYPQELAWRLVEWCHGQGAEEFTLSGIVSGEASAVTLKPFDDAAAPHKRPQALRRRLSWRQGEAPVAFTDMWTLNSETLTALRLAFPYGPFDYRPADAWFEDLAIYRDEELMLGIITHEHEGVLRVTDVERGHLVAARYPVRLEGEWVGY